MSINYWNKKHQEEYSKVGWIQKPSMFAGFALKYFPKTGKLLDIGTGQGQDARYFRDQGYKVTATDYSDQALNNAKRNITDVVFMKLDTEVALPFENNSFDIVYSHLALHYFDNETTRKIFADIHRILKPGGVLATITNTIKDPEIKDPAYREIEPGLHQAPSGITKRYFSLDYMKQVTEGLFTPLLLDAKGETYKDELKTLIRFIGKK